jgi:hypothetical protein
MIQIEKHVSIYAKGGCTSCKARKSLTGRWTLVPGSVIGVRTHAKAIIIGLNADSGAVIHGDEYPINIKSSWPKV